MNIEQAFCFLKIFLPVCLNFKHRIMQHFYEIDWLSIHVLETRIIVVLY